jgi:hypothetical protein
MKTISTTMTILLFLWTCGESHSSPEARKPLAATPARAYRDPGGIFTLDVPDGWNVERHRDPAGWSTLVSHESPIAKLVILANPIPETAGKPPDLRDQQLVGLAQPIFHGWIEALRGQARVEIVRKAYRLQMQGIPALRLDVRYFRNDAHDPREGHAMFLLSRRNSFFVSLSGERAGVEAGERVLAGWRIAAGE